MVAPRELMETSSTNIIDAVASQPGVAQITTGSGISKPVIRGLGYNRIVTVNDGIRQEGQQWGDEHGIEVDAQTVHSVGGEYQTNNRLWDYSVDFAGNKSGIVWNWRWSQKDAGEYKNKRDGKVWGSQFREQALTGMVGLNRRWGYSHLKFSTYHITPGLVEGERDEATGDLLRSEAYQKIYHTKVVSDNSFILGDGSLKAVIGYQQNRRKEFEGEEEPGLYFRLHTINYDVHYVMANDFWQFATGVSGMWQHSENLGEEFLIPSYRLFDIGAFASVTRNFEHWTLSGGLRFDHRHLHSYALEEEGEERFTDFSRNFKGLTGSIGAIYRITSQWNMRLNLSHGFRAPNLSELGSNGEHEGTFRYEIGNHDLSPEHSWQLDLGIDYSSSILSAQLSLFANHIDNYIFLQRLSDASNEYQYMAGDARLWGGEVSVDLHPVEPLHFQNSFSYVNAVQLHQSSDSRYLPFTPAPRLNSTLRYDITHSGRVLNNTYLSLGLTCYLRQDHVHRANDTETETPSYTLVNLSAGTDVKWKGKRVASVFLSAANLFDRVYQSHLSRLKYADGPGICDMGRNITIKLLVPIAL